MRGRLIDLSAGAGQKQRIIVEIDADFRNGFDALHDADVEITIRKYRPKRSKDSNAYFHVLVNAIAEAKGIGDDEVKRDLITQYGVIERDEAGRYLGFKLPFSADPNKIYPYTKMYKQVVEDGKSFCCYLLYKRSSDMDTKEMARLIDGAIYEARQLGIETDTPSDRTRWGTE